MTTPPPAPEVLEAMRAAFKQRSSQMMGDPGKLDYNAIELEAFAAAAGALAAAGWRPPVAVPEGRENKPQRREAPMTLDLEALKRVAEAATPGPWEVSDTDVLTSAFVRAPRFGHVCNAPVPLADCYEREINQNSQARKNIAHIATFDPPTVLALIARCEAAEKERDEWQRRAESTFGNGQSDGYYYSLVSKVRAARAAGFRDGIEAAAKDLHAHVVLGDGHGTACAIERHLRALTAAPEPQA